MTHVIHIFVFLITIPLNSTPLEKNVKSVFTRNVIVSHQKKKRKRKADMENIIGNPTTCSISHEFCLCFLFENSQDFNSSCLKVWIDKN